MREFDLRFVDELQSGECYLHLRRQKIRCVRHGEQLLATSVPSVLAEAFTDYLLEDWQRQRLWQMIYDIFDCFTLAEQHWLALAVQHRMAGKTDLDLPFCGEHRHEKLKAILLDYFKNNDRLDLRGFLHFRLMGWEQALLVNLAACADKLILAKDEEVYCEFLRNMVACRTEGELLNIVISKKAFWIYTGMPPSFAECGSRSYGDELLLARIILAAPSAVNLHFEQGETAQAVVDLLAQTFGKRFVLCEGCSLCRKKSQETL
ncbi:MAG: sporulation protein YtxC [Clostridia bacterium]|nr:sporulation protein YtxC [Clostridia bacterium]